MTVRYLNALEGLSLDVPSSKIGIIRPSPRPSNVFLSLDFKLFGQGLTPLLFGQFLEQKRA